MPARTSFLARVTPLLGSTLAVLLLWQLAVSITTVPRVILPGPLDVAGAFRMHGAYILRNVAVTIGEALAGFVVGSVFALACALAFVSSVVFRRAFYPLALLLKTTPLVVLAPLLIIWLGSGTASKVIMSGVLAFFPVLVAAFDGLRATDDCLLDLLHMHGARPIEILFRVRLPYALPQLLSGLRVASPLAVTGAVIAEYISSTDGVGYVIANGAYHLSMDQVYAAIISISLVSLALFGMVCLAERYVVFWTNSDSRYAS